MADKNNRKRFGCLAMQKGFITEDQFFQAMKVQVSEEQKGGCSALIGQILKNMGFMTDGQVEEVIKDSLEFERFKCPECGLLFHECPNCGINLRKFRV